MKKNKKNNKFLMGCNKVLKWLSSVVLTILIIIGLLLLFVFITGKIAQKKNEVAPIGLYTIISPSMVPNIKVYDVVVVRKIKAQELKKGDIITFYSLNPYLDNTPVTHRIVDFTFGKNNELMFITRGDNNNVHDATPVTTDRLVGKVIFKLPQLGRLQFFLASKGGWLIAILIPALGVISYDIYKIIKLITIKEKITKIKKESSETK